MCLIINFLVEVSVKPIHYSLPDNRVVTTHSPLPSHLHTTFPWTFFLPPPLTLVLSVLIKYKNPYYVFSSTLTLQLSLLPLRISVKFAEVTFPAIGCIFRHHPALARRVDPSALVSVYVGLVNSLALALVFHHTDTHI